MKKNWLLFMIFLFTSSAFASQLSGLYPPGVKYSSDKSPRIRISKDIVFQNISLDAPIPVRLDEPSNATLSVLTDSEDWAGLYLVSPSNKILKPGTRGIRLTVPPRKKMKKGKKSLQKYILRIKELPPGLYKLKVTFHRNKHSSQHERRHKGTVIIKQPRSPVQIKTWTEPFVVKQGESVKLFVQIEGLQKPSFDIEATYIDESGKHALKFKKEKSFIYSSSFKPSFSQSPKKLTIVVRVKGKRGEGIPFERTALASCTGIIPQASIQKSEVRFKGNNLFIPVAGKKGDYQLELIFVGPGNTYPLEKRAWVRAFFKLLSTKAHTVSISIPDIKQKLSFVHIQLRNKKTMIVEDEMILKDIAFLENTRQQ